MIAFVCCSPVQIMRAVHMKMRHSIFSAHADIYVSYKCPGFEKFADNLKDIGIFRNVYATDISYLGKRKVFKLLFGNSKWSQIIRNNKYDKLVTFNIEDELAQAIFCMNHKNHEFEHHCVEDGPNIYQIYEPPRYKWYHPFKWLGWDRQAYHIKAWWTSCPEFIKIPKSFHTEKRKLKAIDCTDSEYIRIVNQIFEYSENEALENADLLIMEESHFTDGLMIDNADFRLYKNIREKYPHLNILVKLHPRTVTNRFTDDFDVMEKSELPWELYVLNREHNKKKDLIQISIVCGTMISDRFMFGIEGKKIILAPLFYELVRVPENGTPRVSPQETHNYEQVKKSYLNSENFVIAYCEDELYHAIDHMTLG